MQIKFKSTTPVMLILSLTGRILNVDGQDMVCGGVHAEGVDGCNEYNVTMSLAPCSCSIFYEYAQLNIKEPEK